MMNSACVLVGSNGNEEEEEEKKKETALGTQHSESQ